MSKSSKKTGKPLPGWATGTLDGKMESGKQEPYTRIGVTLLKHSAFIDLNPCAKLLYSLMTLECGGNREFTFPLHTAAQYGINAKTLRRSVKELAEAGFIEIVQSGKITREPNRYRFIFDWKLAPITHGKTDGVRPDSKDSKDIKND